MSREPLRSEGLDLSPKTEHRTRPKKKQRESQALLRFFITTRQRGRDIYLHIYIDACMCTRTHVHTQVYVYFRQTLHKGI